MSTTINITETAINVVVTEETITIEASGGQGPVGPTGQGVPIGGTAGQVLAKINSTNYNTQWVTQNTGLTSVGLSAPTGFSVTGSPLTANGVLALSFTSGYSLPLIATQTTWTTAYNRSLTSAAVTGTTTKTLTLNQQDGGTITASWTDINTDAVTSVFGRTGVVVATSGDYTTTLVTEGTNLYYTDVRSRSALSFVAGSGAYNSTTGVITIPTNTTQLTNGSAYITLTSLSAGTGISYSNTTGVITSTITQYTDALARASISLTTSGTSGAATYNSTTGVLNIPSYVGAITSVFGRTGVVIATEGDYSLTQLSDVTITSPTTGQVLKYNGTAWINDTDANSGTVTSVGLSAPTGFSVSSSPVTTSGTLSLTFASGYSLPTNTSQTNWDSAYTNRITSLTVTGSSGASTLISNVLNIPTYTLSGLGGQPLATNLTSLSGLTYASASFVKMTAAGTFTLDTNTYLTGNQSITLSGDVSGSGTTAITTTIGALKVTNAMLAGSIDLTTKVTGLLPDANISSAATWNAKQNATSLFNAQSGTVTATATNGIVVYDFNAAGSLVLPTAVSNTAIFYVKNRHTANITVTFTSGQNADGTTSITLIPNQSLQFISNNTNYNIH